MRILVIAPHADDEVLGVGGTMARYAEEGHEVVVAVMTGPGDGKHPCFPRESWDQVRAEAKNAHDILGVAETIFEEIPAVLLPDQPLWTVNQTTLKVMARVRPEVMYIPFPFDLHRDHRELAYACCVGWRPTGPVGQAIREVYAYETVSETHWNLPYLEPAFVPNQWVDISRHIQKKRKALQCFESQMRRFPDARSIEAVDALATWRGTQMSLNAAEAFITIRRVWK